jgi:SAM-dependent methyltransferase
MATIPARETFPDKQTFIQTLTNPQDSVLDVGFWGQAVKRDARSWPHGLLKARASEVWGVDIEFDPSQLEHPERYQKAPAEEFNLPRTFTVVFASELIEHLTNPGLFLDCARRHLAPGGVLVLTTPNAFNLFVVLEKLFKREPGVNSDHTFYFNHAVLAKLLDKCGYEVVYRGYIDTFHPPRGLRRLARPLLRLTLLFTPKFLETIVVIACPKENFS